MKNLLKTIRIMIMLFSVMEVWRLYRTHQIAVDREMPTHCLMKNALYEK